MGTRYVPQADQPRVRLLAVSVFAATLVIALVAVFAPTLRLESSAGEAAEIQQRGGYGPGYPLHGGLAGPSRVQPSVVVPTYPHGGFAGPSQIRDGD